MSKRSAEFGGAPPKRVFKPSSHEIQVARETAELFKSNIFKLQIDELLNELKLKPAHCYLIEKVLHKLHSIIHEVPESEPLSLPEAQKLFKNTKFTIPFTDPKPSDINYSLQYKVPEDINLVGSFGLKSGIKQKHGMSIDVCLTMDKTLLQPKDYLNFKFLHKRAFYLAYLAKHLSVLAPETNLPIDISYDFHNGDVLCPTLIIRSVKSDNEADLTFENTHFSIRLLLGIPQGVFDAKKLLPDRNCIRIQNHPSDSLPPTPLYNASILQTANYVYYLKYLHTTKRATESFRDAASLSKLWLNQRGLSSHMEQGGFGHFEFCMLMAALLDGGGDKGHKILLHGYSSYQLFKGVIRYLATQDLCENGYLSFSSVIGEGKSVYKDTGFGTPTIFDKNTKINILWKMTPASYAILKKFAIETHDLLNDVISDRFNQIFILNNTNAYTKYDATISIPYSTLVDQLEDLFTPVERVSFITLQKFIKSKILYILTKALEQRVTEIDVRLSQINDSFPLNKRSPSNTSKSLYVVIGLFLNPSESEKRVTKGPTHSEQEIGEQFSAFWGEKAQLRRYKDGTVQWSCLWDVLSPTQGVPTESPVIKIIKYILDRHLKFSVSDIIISNTNKFSSLLPIPVVPFAETSQPLTLPPQYIQLKDSFHKMVKTLERLNIPVGIRGILPVSTALRSTSVILPIPFATASPEFWNECIIQFDNSANGKWPHEINALEDTKCALLLKISSILNQEVDGNGDGYKSFIIKDDESVPYNSKIRLLRILTPEGYGFQLRVVTEFEEQIYLSAIDSAPVSQRKLLETIYFHFYRKSIASVRHHRTVSTMITQFPMYSATVRLFKIWLDRQMLLCHLSDEVVELIVLKVFVDAGPYSVPSTVMSGFLRTVQFLSQWNWIEDSIVMDVSRDFQLGVNLNSTTENKITGKFTVAQYQSIVATFTKIREHDPKGLKLPWFIVTKDDFSGKIWSFDVSMVTATRITTLSKLIMSIFRTDDKNLGAVNIDEKILKTVFTPALNDFDIVVKLNEVTSTDNKRKLSGIYPSSVKFKNLVTPPGKFKNDGPDANSIIAGLDSDYCYNLYNDVKARYEGVIWSIEKYAGLFNFGQKERSMTGLIIPGHKNKKFRVGMGWNMKVDENEEPENDNVTVSLDLDDVLKSVALLGAVLIKQIDRRGYSNKK